MSLSVLTNQTRVWTKFRHSKLFVRQLPQMEFNRAPMSIDIGGMRVKYRSGEEAFVEADLLCKEPIGQFKAWFDEACNTPGIIEANAMCLATATKDGLPSARYVLLKGFGSDGFKFYTNYSSRKGRELDENPRAALTFYWDILKRSVRVEGSVVKLPTVESEEYFNSRPLESRVGACCSHQSAVVASRGVLMDKRRQLNEMYEGTDQILCRPNDWGGFLVEPVSIEFWQGQSDRLHDRIRFRKKTSSDQPDGIVLHEGDNGWVYERLSP